MQITFERTGGFAGIRLAKVIDTTTLTSEEAEGLRLLVDASDFFQLPASITSLKNESDRFQYKITLEDGERKHTIVVGEQAIPKTLRPLLDWLMAAARRG